MTLQKVFKKPNVSQETIEVNAFVMVLKLPPSCFTYAMTQALSLYFASTSLTSRTMALLEVLIISKKPIGLLFVVQKMHDHHKGIHSNS
jgi:hypothetical protein